MICNKCGTLSRGKVFKTIKCKCGLESSNYLSGADICYDCSEQYNICRICGTEFSKPIEIDWVHVNKQGE